MTVPTRATRIAGCRDIIGLLVIPLAAVLVQSYAATHVIQSVSAGRLYDGAMYISQGLELRGLPGLTALGDLYKSGLYPLFLSIFDLSAVPAEGGRASVDPHVMVIYAAQTFLLGASTVAFLFLAYRILPRRGAGPIISLAALAVILVSPLVVVWPSRVLAESLNMCGILAFALACIAYDGEVRFAPLLLAISCIVLVFIRIPMIYYIWTFAGLLVVNGLASVGGNRRAIVVAVVILAIVSGLGLVRTLVNGNTFVQNIANVVQLRILGDPARREYFADRGLPMIPVVLERSGQPAWFDSGALFAHSNEMPADLRQYRDWLATEGRRTYLAFLLTHPQYVLASFFASPNIGKFSADFHYSIADVFARPGSGYSVREVPYPPRLRDFLLAPFGWFLSFAWLGLTTFRFGAATLRRERASAVDLMAVAAGVAVVASYHAEAWDAWRHLLPFVVLVYLSIAITLPRLAGAAFHRGKEILERAAAPVRAITQRSRSRRH